MSSSFWREPTDDRTVSTLSSAALRLPPACDRPSVSAFFSAGVLAGARSVSIIFVSVVNSDCLSLGCYAEVVAGRRHALDVELHAADSDRVAAVIGTVATAGAGGTVVLVVRSVMV